MHNTICGSPLRTLKMEDVEDFQVPFGKIKTIVSTGLSNKWTVKDAINYAHKIENKYNKMKNMKDGQGKRKLAKILKKMIQDYKNKYATIDKLTLSYKQRRNMSSILQKMIMFNHTIDAVLRGSAGGYSGVDLKF